MPLLSDYARTKKVEYFFRGVPKESRILEVGCGDGWLGRYLKANGWTHWTGMDLVQPADVVGNIVEWRRLGMEPASFDGIVAFEVVEHVPCFQEMYDLLKPGGLLMLTSPAPGMDWFCKALEAFGLTQRRTSPHDHLIDFHKVPLFEAVSITRVGLAAQWGIFRKPRVG
jgi:2-polyprenyl-3-methyl-5-hydroxy-6-metoxy-1,4-benzoquinol methylase